MHQGTLHREGTVAELAQDHAVELQGSGGRTDPRLDDVFRAFSN
ncbi:hypothetical protein JD76_05347 [Micromonospora endolithica]|nr:hypothetical protein JD76_05347 [Micromonospora endolithica]